MLSYLLKDSMTYYVFVRTPMYKDSNHIAHLIEHCLFHMTIKSEADFFAVFPKIDAYTYGWYSQYECSTQHALHSLMQSINTDITPDILRFEQATIKDELSKPVHKKQLADAISKKLYCRYSVLATPLYTLNDVNGYKRRYYCNYIITDDDFHIIEQNGTFAKNTAITIAAKPAKTMYYNVKV